ncbi:A/G-specific adenine glycosylase [Mariniblastus sp.]|nr:A/G-specific adenine glycosylase [Mariniblastus sp.]
MLIESAQRTAFRRRLLKWFDANQRDLPWRKKRTPYRIWVSEIMLQQTQVATVIDYYRRFMKRFPSVKKLAAAEQSEVLKLWEGLGYYRRARQLHAAAQQVVDQHGGKFPTDFDSVLALPGIGRYTAGAILSISLDQRLPILEGNTIRLFARLLAMPDDPRTTANQKVLWKFSESILPSKRCGDFNQALMELGSEICTPKKPDCSRCPVSNDCPTFVQSLQDQIPAAGKKTKFEDLHEAVVVVRKGQGTRTRFLVRQCGSDERWSGLWDFPRYKVASTDDVEADLSNQLKAQTGLAAVVRPTTKRIKHAVTKYRITLDCFVADGPTGRLKKNQTATQWLTADELSDLPMSTTGRKIAKALDKLDQKLLF